MVNNWEQTEIIKDIFCPFEKKRNLNKKKLINVVYILFKSFGIILNSLEIHQEQQFSLAVFII